MQIRSLKLQNIRSYKSQNIEFPKGSVLLSGDIGAGKSTILLAIEFALFGVRKPALTGATLLRKGSLEGSVELKFNLNKKTVIIKRVIKKAKNDIKQTAGYIVIENVKNDLTPVELKAKILELLGYPQDLLTKHKDIIYRYTVYTPQEEMKAILFEDNDIRLNTLRKVFGIDKYKQIRENCSVYIRELRARKQRLNGMIFDLDDKVKQKKQKMLDLAAVDQQLRKTRPQLSGLKSYVKACRDALLSLEQMISDTNELKKKILLLDAGLKATIDERSRNKTEIERLSNEIDILTKETLNLKNIDVSDKVRQLELKISSEETEFSQAQLNLNEFKIKENASLDLQNNVSNLDVCPVCKQKVTKEHKHTIKDSELEKLDKLKSQIKEDILVEDALSSLIAKHKMELSELRELEKTQIVVITQKKNLEEKKENLTKLQKRMEESKLEIGKINEKKIEIAKSIDKDLELVYRQRRDDFEKLLDDEKDMELQVHGYDKTREALFKEISLLESDITIRLKSKEDIKSINLLENWLNEYFINLMTTMERHVMSQLYSEFNESFIEWFSALISDEGINSRLDDQFAPVIEQNGYETELINLSGGEKTSIALAYRLALNKVINDYISHIKTRDIIILDEPTDGFSDEQLNRVRDVLENLNISQIIIVSHEPKVESFVDSIIRIEKSEHVSSAVIL